MYIPRFATRIINREILKQLAETEPPIKSIADLRDRNLTDALSFPCQSLDLDGEHNPLAAFITAKGGDDPASLFEYTDNWSCSLYVSCESNEQSFLVYLNNGNVVDHAQLPPFRGRPNKEKFEQVLMEELGRSRHKYQDEIEGDMLHPVCHALAINPIQEVSSIRFTLKRICDTMGMEPIQPVFTSDACAHIFRHSERGKSEFPDFPPNLRAAISLARFVQDPLLELCSMWSLEAHDPAAEVLKLNLHPRWEEIPKHLLVTALERELVSTVNKTGVDINYIARQEQRTRQSVLQFVSGLGPRKAKWVLANLSKMAVDTTRELDPFMSSDGQTLIVQNRNQLRPLFPCVLPTGGFKEDDKVQVKYLCTEDKCDTYYDGTIAQVNNDGTHNVTDQNGTIEYRVSDDRLRPHGGGVVFRNAIGFIKVDYSLNVSENLLNKNIEALIAKLRGLKAIETGTVLCLTGDDIDSEQFRVEKLEKITDNEIRCKLSALNDEGVQIDRWYVVELSSALAWPELHSDAAAATSEDSSSFFTAEKWYTCSLGIDEQDVDEEDDIDSDIADMEKAYLLKCSPLDNTRIHPEHYEAAFTIMTSALGCDLQNAGADDQAMFEKFEKMDDSFSFATAKR